MRATAVPGRIVSARKQQGGDMAEDFPGNDIDLGLTLGQLSGEAHPLDAEQEAKAPLMRLEGDDEIPSLVNLFTEVSEGDAVGLIIGGKRAGFLQRNEMFRMLGAPGGWGDSAAGEMRGKVPPSGYGGYFRLECPVPGCPDSPIRMASFDEAAPPHCTTHRDRALRRID
jgi:hypothetical protein